MSFIDIPHNNTSRVIVIIYNIIIALRPAQEFFTYMETIDGEGLQNLGLCLGPLSMLSREG
jgi:hypothetical protein